MEARAMLSLTFARMIRRRAKTDYFAHFGPLGSLYSRMILIITSGSVILSLPGNHSTLPGPPMTKAQIAQKLALIKRGDRIVIDYNTEKGEERRGVVGFMRRYEDTPEGKRSLAATGEIKPSPWDKVPPLADGSRFGLQVLRKESELPLDQRKIALGFQKMMRNESGGTFARGRWTTLNVQGLQNIKIIRGKRVIA